MKHFAFFGLLCLLLGMVSVQARTKFEKDVIKTKAGDLIISFVGHGSLFIEWGGKVLHVDPFGKLADYQKLPKADVVLITHQHGDHLDLEALGQIRKENTQVVLTRICAEKMPGGIVMKNGDTQTIMGIRVDAVSAYNLVHQRPDGKPFHPKGEGNGYVLTMGGKRIYVAGDTEAIPEMKELKNIDIAFLPMNLPYTMTPEMVFEAVKSFKPKILYPYHFGETDTSKIVGLLKSYPDTEVRIRKMQ